MLRRLAFALAILAATLASAIYVAGFWPLRNPHPPLRLATGTLAIRGARIYRSPDEPPIERGTIVVREGRIAAIGEDIPIPADATVLPCNACSVTAGFWNAHVHFTESKWNFSEWRSAGTLNAQLADRLTSRGFTTVVDAGSNLRVSIPLRRRIETGDLRGPYIYTAGAGQYPPDGIPYYLRESLPRFIQLFLPQPRSPAEAARDEERNIAQGADVLKLFTGSYAQRGKVVAMPEANAAAAVAVAHGHGQLAYSHPSNLAGVLVAIHSGVDVLAHAPDTTAGIGTAVLQAMADKHMAMIPTLKMFATTVTTAPEYLNPIYDEVRQFHALGGQLLFGTDVGYMRDYTTAGEFGALQASGLGPADILRMLTTAPAARFGVQDEKGRIAPGQLADLVVLESDPYQDVTAFSKVLITIRSGRVIHARR
jgi:imidazolonepropionase-like amidohydrolase